jgi:hypothetical protein
MIGDPGVTRTRYGSNKITTSGYAMKWETVVLDRSYPTARGRVPDVARPRVEEDLEARFIQY